VIAKKQRDFEHTYHDEEDDDRYFNSRQLAKLRATRYNEKVRRDGDRTVKSFHALVASSSQLRRNSGRLMMTATGRMSGLRMRRL
jgi:hypothetical protein